MVTDPGRRLRKTLRLVWAGLLLVPAGGTHAQGAPSIANRHTRIEALGGPGKWTGVVVKSDGHEVASVGLTSEGRWLARQAVRDSVRGGTALTLRGFDTSATGNTPALGPASFVRFALTGDEPFPRVTFRLDIKSFDREAWERAWPEPCPVHFLACSIEEPELYYFHGLLAPTPRVDPYPFSSPDMRAAWADGWSTAPAIGALTVPAVALWRPSTGRLVAYSFQHARSTDQSGKHISVACRWGMPPPTADGFTLIWPYQRRWQELTYPSGPVCVESHFDLLYDLDTGPTGDVNRFILDHIWSRYRDLLPTVPRMNDLGWMVPRRGFRDDAPGAQILHRIDESTGSFCSLFFRDETQVLGGSFRAVDLRYRRGDEEAVALLREDVDLVLSRAIWESIDGNECVYWKHPFEGGWKDRFGGDRAGTVHNVQQFAFAGALLAMYVHEPSDRLWRYIEGLYNWARHCVYTRGGICDIPGSTFTLQTSRLALNFLMNLHYSLRDDADPHKRQIAQDAFDLAVTVVWRNANITTSDPDGSDTLDPAFLMPGNHARPWLGQVSWAELCDVFRSMIVMYAETGDPRFKYYVRGALEKWHTGFEPDGYHTAENLDVFGETEGGKGSRTGVHGPQDSFWEWAQPVGDAILHVTGGRAAAIAFCKGTTSLDVADYRFRSPSSFSFHIAGAREGEFEMVFSSPYRDLSGLDVFVNGEETVAEVAGALNEHLLLTVQAGATVEIGRIEDAPAARSEPASKTPAVLRSEHQLRRRHLHRSRAINRSWTAVPTHPASFGRIRVSRLDCLDLAPYCTDPVGRSWDEPGSWAGLPAGRSTAYGIPCIVTDPDTNRGRMAVYRGSVPIDRRVEGLFLISTRLRLGEASILLSSQALVPVQPQAGLKIRDGLPLREWELWLYPVIVPRNVDVEEVRVRGQARLFAVTLAPGDASEVERILRMIPEAGGRRAAHREAIAERERMVLACRERVREQRRQKGALRAGFLPPRGSLAPRIRNALDELGIPSVALRPEELVDPALFTVADYPILIYTHPEHYLRSVHEYGDGEAALIEHLRRGGTLVVMGPARPFTYADDRVALSAGQDPLEWVLFGREFGLDLVGPDEERGGAIGFEEAPSGELVFRVEEGQDILTGLPEKVAFPSAGDRRYRPATADALSPGDEFVPVLTLYDESDTRYGPAVALVRRHSSGATANILYVWGTLIGDDFEHADTVLYQTLARAAELSLPASLTPALTPGGAERVQAAVGILPLADEARAQLVRDLCDDMNEDWADVPPDAFVDRARFSPARVAVAVHAPTNEAFVNTWRVPNDGAEAYARYVDEGGFLIACGNATQFWYLADRADDGWEFRHPTQPVVPRALGLPIVYGFEQPAGPIFLELEEGQQVFTTLAARTDVSSISDQRWRGLMPVRGTNMEFTPLAYLADEQGSRYEGCAAALIRRRGLGTRLGAILYIWGNLIDGDLAEPIMRAALKFAVDDVQEMPSDATTGR